MAEHIATIPGAVLFARILADIVVFVVKRNTEKKHEKLVIEYEIKCINKKLDVLEKDICILIQERSESE